MPNKRWILSISPVHTDVAKPGRLVTKREAPQNYFHVHGDPKLTKTEFRGLAELHNLFNNNNLQLKLTSFLSKFFNIRSDAIRSIEATKAERCQLVQADEWLNNICMDESAQAWLERNVISLRRKVWMITDVLVLTDTKIKAIDRHTHSIGGEVSAPVLSIAGVMIPTSLDPSVGATTARYSSHEGAVFVPERMVFAIQYSQVKLVKRKRSEFEKAADYELRSKTTWTPLWEMRGASEEHRGDSDEEIDDEYDEEAETGNDDEDVLQVTLTDDSDGEEYDDDGEDDANP